MDLSHYKKAWENQPEEKNKISDIEIYKMTQSKSISIVKWIFIIGILEFVIMNSFYFFFDDSSQKEMMDDFGMTNILLGSQIIAYVILFYFLVMFYKNYREISVIDNTKILMTKILKTRRTVRNYVVFNLTYLVFVSLLISIGFLRKEYNHFDTKQTILFLIGMLVVTAIMVLVFWLFYQLLYGILLRKLNKNYKNLSELEVK
tara:strand:+ start:3189 stop:3797 length:609 start_codon:yes stop_codon:yes gene_type:complete